MKFYVIKWAMSETYLKFLKGQIKDTRKQPKVFKSAKTCHKFIVDNGSYFSKYKGDTFVIVEFDGDLGGIQYTLDEFFNRFKKTTDIVDIDGATLHVNDNVLVIVGHALHYGVIDKTLDADNSAYSIRVLLKKNHEYAYFTAEECKFQVYLYPT
jgi:hypothetical protein